MSIGTFLYRNHKIIDTPHFGYASLYWLRHELASHFGFLYTQKLVIEDKSDEFFYKNRLHLTDDDIKTFDDKNQREIINYHKFVGWRDELIRWEDEDADEYLRQFFVAPDNEGLIDLEHCRYYYDKFKNVKLKDNQKRLNILLAVLKAGIENNSAIVYL